MRFLRFFLLVLLLCTGYFAQYLIDHRTLADFFPGWLLELFPALRRFTWWLPGDLLDLAFWAAVISALGFGLIIPEWRGTGERAARLVEAPDDDIWRPWARWTTAGLFALAAVLALYVVGSKTTGSGVTAAGGIAWVAAGTLFLGGAATWTLSGAVRTRTVLASSTVHPYNSWSWLPVVLALAGVVHAFRLVRVPSMVDELTARNGLQALQWVNGNPPPLFENGLAQLPGLSSLVTSLAYALTDDLLVASRLVGFVFTLGLMIATWVLGCELFRRVPLVGEYEELVEDDGGWIAVLAATFVGLLPITFPFARVPLHLESALWATLGVWAIVRSARVHSPILPAAAGILTGYACYTSPAALAMLPAGLLLWAGVFLLRGVGSSAKAKELRLRGWQLFALWLAGVAVAISPLIAGWVGRANENGSGFADYVLSVITADPTVDVQSPLDLWQRLQRTALAYNFYPDESLYIGFDGSALGWLAAPLFLLAVGALLANADRLFGWTLLVWPAAVIVTAAIVGPSAPLWPLLVPTIPAAGLAMAFAFDRIRTTVAETVGTWTLQASVYLAIGLAMGIGLLAWVNYYEFASVRYDLVDNLGQAVRALPQDRAVYLVSRQGDLARHLSAPSAQFLTNGRAVEQLAAEITPGTWPDELEPNAVLLIAPDSVPLLDEIRHRYPGGRLTVQRNLRAVPVLYIYRPPQIR